MVTAACVCWGVAAAVTSTPATTSTAAPARNIEEVELKCEFAWMTAPVKTSSSREKLLFHNGSDGFADGCPLLSTRRVLHAPGSTGGDQGARTRRRPDR